MASEIQIFLLLKRTSDPKVEINEHDLLIVAMASSSHAGESSSVISSSSSFARVADIPIAPLDSACPAMDCPIRAEFPLAPPGTLELIWSTGSDQGSSIIISFESSGGVITSAGGESEDLGEQGVAGRNAGRSSSIAGPRHGAGMLPRPRSLILDFRRLGRIWNDGAALIGSGRMASISRLSRRRFSSFSLKSSG